MPVALQLYSDPDYTVSTVLDGVAYELRFLWNSRLDLDQKPAGWFLHIATSDGTPLVSGARVRLGVALGSRCVDPRFWPGMLMAVDLSGDDIEPGLEDMGVRVQVYYYPVAEKPASEGEPTSALGLSNRGTDAQLVLEEFV